MRGPEGRGSSCKSSGLRNTRPDVTSRRQKLRLEFGFGAQQVEDKDAVATARRHRVQRRSGEYLSVARDAAQATSVARLQWL